MKKIKIIKETISVFWLVIITACSSNTQNIADRGVWVQLENGQECDGYISMDNKIYGVFLGLPQDYKLFDPLADVDFLTFEVCKGSGYAKDVAHVYYPLRVICEDGLIEDEDGNSEREYGGCYFQEYIIEGSDPSTFKYIGDGYAVDKANMYHHGKKIPWDNSVLEHPEILIRTAPINLVDTIPIIKMEEP